MPDIAHLEEILSPNNIVLVDGSICRSYTSGDLCREMYPARYYQNISLKHIGEKSTRLNKISEVLKRENAYTIKEVSDEISNLTNFLNGKIKIFKENEKKFKTKNSAAYEIQEKADAISDLQEQSYQLATLAKRKDLMRELNRKINPLQYNSLLNIVKIIDRTIGLKKDTGYILGDSDINRSHNSDTDERLVAALYCLSLTSRLKPVIIAGDTDFVKLFGTCTGIMRTRDFYPENKEFILATKSNPFEVYMENEKGFDLTIRSDKMKSEPIDFNIKNKNYSENVSIREQIIDLWKSFSLSQQDQSISIK